MNRPHIALAALAALGVAPTAVAQDLPKSQAELRKRLGLTAEQKKRIDVIDARYNPKVKVVVDKYTPQLKNLQKQMVDLQKRTVELQKRYLTELKPILDQRGKEVEAVLTPQQRDEVKKIDSQLKQRAAAQRAVAAPPRK